MGYPQERFIGKAMSLYQFDIRGFIGDIELGSQRLVCSYLPRRCRERLRQNHGYRSCPKVRRHESLVWRWRCHPLEPQYHHPYS